MASDGQAGPPPKRVKRDHGEQFSSVKNRVKLVEFKNVGKKKLTRGRLSKKVGGLLDRQESINQMYRALERLAAHMGEQDLDERSVPIIVIHGRSGAGKTEFLRWIFNNCCTFHSPKTTIAKNLVKRLNLASPKGKHKFENLLVLLASFNEASTYSKDEGPICGTTVERLLRSFHGNTEFQESSEKRIRYRGLHDWQNIVDAFSATHGKTGFVFVLDDLNVIKENSESEYNILMDSILQFSHKCLQNGIFCAVVGSVVSAYDIGESVVSKYVRAMEPIHFPREMPEMEAKAKKMLLKDADNHEESLGFSFSVTMKVLQSLSTSVSSWEDYLCSPWTRTKIEPLVKPFRIPMTEDGKSLVSPDYLFLVLSRTVLGKECVENLKEECVEAVVDHLSGHLVLDIDTNGQISDWTIPRGTLTLPGWRLFQLSPSYNEQMFSLIQNWVLVETRKMFYEYGPAEGTRTLEVTTMAILELRKAMIQAANGSPPTLRELFDGIRVHHNLSKETLNAKASELATGLKYFSPMPYSFEVINEPYLYLTNVQEEKGFEGMLRDCFDGTTVFFQTKLYAAGSPEEICDWLVSAHKRARELHYQRGEYIVQLFVPGDAMDESNKSFSRKWPKNSMVISDNALMDLFDPFISLTLY